MRSAVYFQFVPPSFPGLKNGQAWSKLLVVQGLQVDDAWKEGPEGLTTRITIETYDQIRTRFEDAIEVGEVAQLTGYTASSEEAARLRYWLDVLRERRWQPGRQQLIRVRVA